MTTTLYLELERMASLTVGTRIRSAINDLIKAGRELEGLSTKGHAQWAIESDARQRADLASTVAALQSLAIGCWQVVMDLRTLDQGLVGLPHRPTRGPDRSDWPFPIAHRDGDTP